MNLYIIKRSNYKLYPVNLIGLFINFNNELTGVNAFFRKKDAKKYIEEFNKGNKYPVDCDIIKIEIKEKEV